MDRTNARSQVVMCRSLRITASACCNIAKLTAVTGQLEQGTPRSCAFPTFPPLTLFAQRPTKLLSTAAHPQTLPSCLWMFLTFSFSATRNSTTASCATAEVSSVGNLCQFIHRMRGFQMCITWNNSFLVLLLAIYIYTKVGHYFLGNLCNMKFPNTPQPCFKPILFYTFFFINAPNQFTPHLNLHPLNFGLTPFGWFISIYLSIFFYWEYFWFMPFSFMPISSVITLAHTIRPWCYVTKAITVM